MDRRTAMDNKLATTGQRKRSKPVIGYAYVHSAVDDHFRLAYSEVPTDERKETATGFRRRANSFFTRYGITVERVLTDNGSCYESKLFTQGLTAAGITHKKTRPYRPQTNGKVERFNRTLLNEWAYLRPYTSEHERTEALADFLRTYDHHRSHTALNGHPPISRVNNAAGQYRPADPDPSVSGAGAGTAVAAPGRPAPAGAVRVTRSDPQGRRAPPGHPVTVEGPADGRAAGRGRLHCSGSAHLHRCGHRGGRADRPEPGRLPHHRL
ncbi:hypothetical protein Sros01_79740 [Streptomyces roseochromogenus]|nr:hypothetical protein Sros01_79740 [Streptomyces roseochromogenus]